MLHDGKSVFTVPRSDGGYVFVLVLLFPDLPLLPLPELFSFSQLDRQGSWEGEDLPLPLSLILLGWLGPSAPSLSRLALCLSIPLPCACCWCGELLLSANSFTYSAIHCGMRLLFRRLTRYAMFGCSRISCLLDMNGRVEIYRHQHHR